MNGTQDYSEEEEVYLSDPSSGEEEDVATEDDYEYEVDDGGSETEYENAVEAGGSSGVSTPQHAAAEDAAAAAALEAAVSDISQPAAPAPRGLPGLPPKPAPKGGLPALPPKPAPKPAPGSTPAESSSAPASAATSTAPPPAQRSGLPSLPGQLRRPGLPGLPARPTGPPAAPAAAAAPAAIPAAPEEPEEPEKVKKVRRQVQGYRTNIFRAALRLRYPTRSSMLGQLMYRLGMAERIHLQSNASPQRDPEGQAQADAERLEVLGEPLDFSCTVLVLGLSGVGKSAAIRSLLGQEEPAGYEPTASVQVLRGQASGIPITFIDTPGLEAGPGALADNLRKLHSAKRAWNRHKPHGVLYFDRLDATRRDQADLSVMRAITDVFGPDVWFSTVLTLTHATAPPPDGPQGTPVPLDAFHQQRSAQLQQLTRAVSMDQRLMNPVALVEASPSCPRSADGEPVLPSGTPWRRQLLMLCFTTKVLNEANTVLKPGAGAAQARSAGGFGGMGGMKVPPLGWLLSRLVDFRGPRKPPEDEREIARDDELDRLSGPERGAALRKKRMFLKQKAEEARADDSAVPILAPEPQMGPSFDPDTSSHHFKVLEDPTGVLIRPIVSDAGVDHEDGVDSVHVEKQMVARRAGQYLGGVPFLGYCQVTKDKNQFACQAQVEGSHHHTSKWASTAELNIQTIGRDVLYTHRLESRLRTGRKNKITAGLIASKLGEDYSHPFKSGALAYGLKIDDRLKISPNAKLRGSLGRVYTRAGQSYDYGTAAAADLKLRPGADPSTRLLLGGSAVVQRRDTTYAGNVATEFRLPKTSGRGGKSDTMLSANASYNNKGNGSITMRLNSHDYPQLAASMAVPLLKAVWDRLMAKEDF